MAFIEVRCQVTWRSSLFIIAISDELLIPIVVHCSSSNIIFLLGKSLFEGRRESRNFCTSLEYEATKIQCSSYKTIKKYLRFKKPLVKDFDKIFVRLRSLLFQGFFPWNAYAIKKVIVFPIPSRDVTNKTLPGRE